MMPLFINLIIMKKIVPSFLTSMNLLCGFWALLINDPMYSFYLILIAITFDFIDGLSARALKVQSIFGKELDSLADMVSFGVVPGYIYYHHIFGNANNSGISYIVELLIATIIPICVGLRLAKFNVKDSGKKYFSGLPSSAGAFFLISIPFLNALNYWTTERFENYNIIFLILPVLISLLMVSKIPMFSFKNVNGGIRKNIIQILFLASLVIGAISFKLLILPMSILLYIILSALFYKAIQKT